jgi:ribonuclease J
VLSLLRPKYLVPVHRRVQTPHSPRGDGREHGIPRENIFVLENGDRMEFRNGKARKIEPVSAGMFLVDAGTVADTSESIMRERQQLSEEGMFIVVARINAQSGELLGHRT